MWGNVKHSPKKERGVKEALTVTGIAGNMGSNIKLSTSDTLPTTRRALKLYYGWLKFS